MVWCHTLVLAALIAGNPNVVLLDFGADWCGPCRTMEPTVKRLEDAGYPVRRVNVDENRELARRFNVASIPCFVLVKESREVDRVVGATSYDRLVQMYERAGDGEATATEQERREQSPSRGSSPDPGGQSEQARQRALEATVRLRVADANGYSRGTGTIIDVHDDEALVLTCGHMFRESQGQGDIQVELFVPGAQGSTSGSLIAYECDERDFGLVSIRPDVSVKPVPVASPACHPREGQEVFSIGCDHGENATVRTSTISAMNRYVGPPNIEIRGCPVEGRSGGGLFTTDGRIIGICNAADRREDRGLYAGLPTIHLALDQIGQKQIYLEQSSGPQVASGPEPRALPDSPPLSEPRGPSPAIPVSPAAHQSPATASVSSRPNEMICIVRSADGSNRMVTITDPSPELMQRMTNESRRRTPAVRPTSDTSSSSSVARLSELPSAKQPVVRAQDR